MYRIIKTELWKLKRYHIIWAGILLMLLSVGITLFSSTALDGTVWTFPFLVEQVIKNNTTTIFPMCITLIAGYIIAREKNRRYLKKHYDGSCFLSCFNWRKTDRLWFPLAAVWYSKYRIYSGRRISCGLSRINGGDRNTGFGSAHI